ncbi:MAG: PilN domain-containing protein [Luminiphilus sp.]|jgi:type IV pilus assembly protein PilN|nr:PilN domain-containing protein [Luminiphilus sp.]
MPSINLLPWREGRRQRRKHQFLLGLGSVLIAAMLSLWVWGQVVNIQISGQKMRNEYLGTHIRLLDQEVSEIRDLQHKRNQLIARMRVIQSLQGNRPVMVRLLDQLAKAVPDGVFYTSLRTRAEVVSIQGIAESNNQVSRLLRHLEASDWLESPNLDAVQAAPDYGDQAMTFTLTVNLQLPELGKERSL